MEENNATYSEHRLFRTSEHMIKMFDSVSARLGFDPDSEFSSDDIKLLYNFCRYDEAFNPERTSSWCVAFSEEDLKVAVQKCNILIA